jgi:transcription antitermination factor NusG
MGSWYAVRTPPLKEAVAAEILASRGVTTFVPTETRYRRPHRYSKRRTAVQAPLLARYVLVYGEQWDLMRDVHLVTGVVCQDGRPARIPDRAVDVLRSLSGCSLPTATRLHRSLRIGGEATIRDGAMAGTRVVVAGIKGDRAETVMEWFGSQQRVTLPLDWLDG